MRTLLVSQAPFAWSLSFLNEWLRIGENLYTFQIAGRFAELDRWMRADISKHRGDSDLGLNEIHDGPKPNSNDIETRVPEAEVLLCERAFEAANLSLQSVSGGACRNDRLAGFMVEARQLLAKVAEANAFRDSLTEQWSMRASQCSLVSFAGKKD